MKIEEYSKKNPLKTPVLFLIFNRPETTKQVFEEIRKAKPKQLFIAADGPRENIFEDKEKCKKTREIVKNIDWDCEVKTLFREKNLGCKYAVSGAIDWFFENVEEGIILEDDCLPSQSFFWFCQDLLRKYRDDQRIMILSGFNKQERWYPNKYDYFFSNFGGIWGWATWKRSWILNDTEMKELNEFIKNHYFHYLLGNKLGNIRQEQMIEQSKDNWDYCWGFARHMNSGLACVPSKSLIKNIGFGKEALHTKKYLDIHKIRDYEINFPLKKNRFIIPDREYDGLFFKEKNILKFIKRSFSC